MRPGRGGRGGRGKVGADGGGEGTCQRTACRAAGEPHTVCGIGEGVFGRWVGGRARCGQRRVACLPAAPLPPCSRPVQDLSSVAGVTIHPAGAPPPHPAGPLPLLLVHVHTCARIRMHVHTRTYTQTFAQSDTASHIRYARVCAPAETVAAWSPRPAVTAGPRRGCGRPLCSSACPAGGLGVGMGVSGVGKGVADSGREWGRECLPAGMAPTPHSWPWAMALQVVRCKRHCPSSRTAACKPLQVGSTLWRGRRLRCGLGPFHPPATRSQDNMRRPMPCGFGLPQKRAAHTFGDAMSLSSSVSAEKDSLRALLWTSGL